MTKDFLRYSQTKEDLTQGGSSRYLAVKNIGGREKKVICLTKKSSSNFVLSWNKVGIIGARKQVENYHCWMMSPLTRIEKSISKIKRLGMITLRQYRN
jgi:hypothetical protein